MRWWRYKCAMDRVLAYAKERGLSVKGCAEYLVILDRVQDRVVFSGSVASIAKQIAGRP